jgi:hypothetical protein
MVEVLNKKGNVAVLLNNMQTGLVWSPNQEVLNDSGAPPETCWEDFAKLLVCLGIPGGKLQIGQFVSFRVLAKFC